MFAAVVSCDRTTAPGAITGSTKPLLSRGNQPTDPTAIFYISNDASALFQGDGIAAYIEPVTSPFTGESRYADGECGVGTRIFALAGESGDVTFGTASTQDHKCAAFPRKVRFTFSLISADGSVTSDGQETVESGGNLHLLEHAAANGNPGLYIPVGTSALRGLHLGDDTGKCYQASSVGGLAFRPVLDDNVTFVGADDVQVFRNAPDTWTVTSIPDEVDPVTGNTIHHDKAYCRGNGKLYHMPLHFSIKSSVPLTP
jgi:hypothetical protein